MKLKYAKTQVTVGDSRTLIVITCGNWRGYQIHEVRRHFVALSDMDIIPGLHANIFSLKPELQRGFHVTSEGEPLILKKFFTDICFSDKMANISGENFIVTAKFI